MTRLSPPSTRQAGVGLVTAIFLLVVLSGLGVAMVSLFTSQQASADLDLQGARAYQAARAGIEWGVYRQLVGKKECKGETFLPMPPNTSLSAFTVIVTLSGGGSGAGSGALARCTIASIACNITDGQGRCGALNNANSVRRQLEVQL
jgi:MSHA biogenesis protein MshP